MSISEPRVPWIEAQFAAAMVLEQEEPDLVALAASECQAGAQRDLQLGTARGKAYVLRLRDLTLERPSLGIAVARRLGLEHIVEDLLNGTSVDGVPGIGADGTACPPSRRDRSRRHGCVLLALGGMVLLIGATTADDLTLFLVVAWTLCSFSLMFAGTWLILRQE